MKLDDDTAESLYRYWFEALANAGESQPVIDATFSENDLWGVAAALQLCFGEKNRNPQVKEKFAQALKDLKVRNNWRYEAAISTFLEISSKKKQESNIKQPSKASTLSKRKDI